MCFSSQDAIIVHRLTQICTDFLGRARHSRARRSLPAWRAEDCSPYLFLFSRFRIAAAQTRWRVTPTNECTYSRSKFGSKENHPGAFRVRRDFHAVTDHRRCGKFDFLRGQGSPGRGYRRVLGHLSGSGIFCALLPDRLRAVAASPRAAERDVGTEARGVFADVALATDE